MDTNWVCVCFAKTKCCTTGKRCAVFAEREAVIKGLEVRSYLYIQTQGHSALISAADNFVGTSAVRGRAPLAVCCGSAGFEIL